MKGNFMNPINIDDFEKDSYQNGIRYWFAHEFMVKLGYENWLTFKSVISKAMASCSSLGVDSDECFIPENITDASGRPFKTYRLSRFACFLITMQADDKKPEVQHAKVVLSAIAAQLIDSQIGNNDIARLEARKDLTAANKILSGTAKASGVQSHQYGLFQDAGFRGMYDMSLEQLRKYKNIDPNATAYDFMGLTELAGNLFRVTQTTERLRSSTSHGIQAAMKTAHQVGSEVRTMMYKNSGVLPEDLAIEDDVSDVKKRLKGANRQMKKLDKKK